MGTSTTFSGKDRFEYGCDPIEVTSIHRPDTGWHTIDANGHEHSWYLGGKPITDGRYLCAATYEHPTVKWVHEGWGAYPDGEPYEIGHTECKDCIERIEPRYKADEYKQYIAGLKWFRINGESVSPEEFERRYKEAYGEWLDSGR